MVRCWPELATGWSRALEQDGGLGLITSAAPHPSVVVSSLKHRTRGGRFVALALNDFDAGPRP